MSDPKIFVLAPNEDWVCDRFVKEWTEFYPDTVNHPKDADIIWLLAEWAWENIDLELLKQKKVIVSVHHLVPDKFGQNENLEFQFRDQFVDAYHVPCKKTEEQVRQLTKKQIFVMPFWVNQNIWKDLDDTKSLLKEFGIDENLVLVGSFQRDTEGKDLISPKLEKGPDVFCDAVEILYNSYKKINIEIGVVLAGWRRQYVMKRLQDAGIKYYYFELPDFETLNKLYNCLDLYIVGSRFEGGPQAILECAAANVPIISTDVGVSSEILSKDSIFKHDLSDFLQSKPNIQEARKNVEQLYMPKGCQVFLDFFRDVK